MKTTKTIFLILLFFTLNKVLAQKYEAENFSLSGGASKQSCSSCLGGSMVSQNEGSLSYSFSVSSVKYVDIYINASTSSGTKTNLLDIDGATSEFTTTSTSYTRVRLVSTLKLNPGNHTMKISKSWGWIDIDYLELVEVPAPVYNINASLITPNPTAEAKCLYQFLRDNYGKKILSGVQEPSEAAWLKQQTGKEPALVGTDLLFIGRGYQSWYDENTPYNAVVNHYKRGGVPTLCWHWRDPSRRTEEFYWQGAAQKYTTFDIRKVNDPNSAEYKAMISDMDYMAKYLQRIQAQNVPLLWRPLHEAAGGWFWWGRDGASCKKLWQIMYDKFVNQYNLRNLIWVWTKQPNDDAFYPGDQYVDIVGRDYYYTGNHTSVMGEFTSMSNHYGNKKLVAITECGSFPDPDNLVKDEAKWSWYMVWPGEYTRSATHNPLDLWKKAFNHSYVLTLDEMPDIRTCSAQPKDCYGTSGGTAANDACGVCIGGTSGRTACKNLANGYYTIKPTHSNLCVESGTAVAQQNCRTGNAQTWSVTRSGNLYRIQNVISGQYLSYPQATSGTNLATSAATNIQWRLEDAGNGAYTLVPSANYDLAVDVSSGSSVAGANLLLWSRTASGNQKFTFTSSVITGLEETDLMGELIHYPNPFHTELQLKVNGQFQYTICDLKGVEKENGRGENAMAVGIGLESGTYVVKVQTVSGTKVFKATKI